MFLVLHVQVTAAFPCRFARGSLAVGQGCIGMVHPKY